jgi:hypothetical protein
MNYSQFELAFAKPRLNKYLYACSGNKRKALTLYRANIKLSQRYYAMLGIFEVTFRNAINSHFMNKLIDADWLVSQASNGFLNKYCETILSEKKRLIRLGNYTNDRLVSTLSFGVWTYMFSRNCFKTSGKTLLQIFPNKTQGINQKVIYHDLCDIRILRNRIAHHEPICFNEAGEIDTKETIRVFELIKQYINFLGYSPNEILYGIESPQLIIDKISVIKLSL